MIEGLTIRDVSEHEGYLRVIAESEDQGVVGKSIAMRWGRSGTMLLEGFSVHPDYRRQGVGSALLSETERLAIEVGGDRMLRLGMFCDEESVGAYIGAIKFFLLQGYSYRLFALIKNLK